MRFDPSAYDSKDSSCCAFFEHCEHYLKQTTSGYHGPYSYGRCYYTYRTDHYRTRFSPKEMVKAQFYQKNGFMTKLETLYKLGFKHYQVLTCSFDEFCLSLILGTKHYKPHYDYRPRMQPYTAFIKKEHHKPKVLSEKELAKKEWRKEKGFERDYRKKERTLGAKTYAKRASNRFHRAWQKQKMSEQDFEALTEIETYEFKNAWMWD